MCVYMYFDLLLDKTLKNAKDVFKVCQHLRKFSYSWYISQLRQQLVALVVLHVCQSVSQRMSISLCVCVCVGVHGILVLNSL